LRCIESRRSLHAGDGFLPSGDRLLTEAELHRVSLRSLRR